jgi:hypothetical protein
MAPSVRQQSAKKKRRVIRQTTHEIVEAKPGEGDPVGRLEYLQQRLGNRAVNRLIQAGQIDPSPSGVATLARADALPISSAVMQRVFANGGLAAVQRTFGEDDDRVAEGVETVGETGRAVETDGGRDGVTSDADDVVHESQQRSRSNGHGPAKGPAPTPPDDSLLAWPQGQSHPDRPAAGPGERRRDQGVRRAQGLAGAQAGQPQEGGVGTRLSGPSVQFSLPRWP